MKAREIIAAELFWPFEGVYGDPSETANDYAARIVSQLAKAGFVILPKEPSKETLLKGLGACCLHFYAHNSAPLVGISDRDIRAAYRAMISHAEGEKG